MADDTGVNIFGIFFNRCGVIGRVPFMISAGATDYAKDEYFTWDVTYTLGTGKIVQALRDLLGAELPWMLPTAASGAPGYTVIADPA
jgi:hypothetical protein